MFRPGKVLLNAKKHTYSKVKVKDKETLTQLPGNIMGLLVYILCFTVGFQVTIEVAKTGQTICFKAWVISTACTKNGSFKCAGCCFKVTPQMLQDSQVIK